MKLTFIDNACCIVEQAGFRILTDPWLSDGAFEGTWYHYPPLRTKPHDLLGVDAVYISHIHPDHFDPPTLAAFPHDMPIIVLDHGQNYLHRALAALGFHRLVKIRDGCSTELGPFRLTAYKPFATDIFHESKIGNVIDSSLAMQAGGYSIFNGNDNNLTLEAAEDMRRRHGTFDVALLKYNAASPYPSCFFNLSEERRLAEAARIRRRNLEYLVAVADVLRPNRVMPFAGNFILAGKQWTKNRFLATATWDAAAAYVRERRPSQKTLVMREGQTFDLKSETFEGPDYSPVDLDAQQRFAQERLASVAYPYESESLDAGSRSQLRATLPLARAGLWLRQQQLGFVQDYNVYIDLEHEFFHFSFGHDRCDFVRSKRDFTMPYLAAHMDNRLLAKIVNRAAHWNNVELGSHMDFYRDPDIYYPDVHVMLSFLHLPAHAEARTA